MTRHFSLAFAAKGLRSHGCAALRAAVDRISGLAFAATVAVLVPAAWHGTDATIDRDGKRVRPLQKEFTVDGARVTLDVDRNLVLTGDPIVAKLRAYSDTPKRVAVDLTVMQSDDTFGSRVASPPRAIDKEHLTLDAAPDGGKVIETKIVMRPNTGIDKIDWFRIYAAPKGTQIDVYGGDEEQNPSIAAVGVLGWSSDDFELSIAPIGKVTAGAPFRIAVRAKNTTGHALKHVPFIQLGTSVGLYSIEGGADFDISEDDDDGAAGDRFEKPFKPGQVVVEKYTVTPKRADVRSATFVASAYVYADEPGPISEGAMEAQTIRIAPAEQPKQVAKQ